ncbi:uncharacterized protein YbjT (DUF2867 family) [Motilibacter rhizosphaerae]|uniref:Uncharacterized protein YbjT (DUF2867 family) n=1 Tax=Motilibacter rhizosphaerae TaxID=598652 RepID=A0A4V2F4J0_9ACTN|nr:NAD(P)H-binding protein [Motilibacter rhizosphaerae]RZS89489.1 uncharacterized protein YbjT (DUF2867 family) [Motilibacter rhizosphaerae]
MIVITGATGALGGATVDHLLQHVEPGALAVVARDPARAARFTDRGVEVRRGDYARPESLRAAFAGAEQLVLVSSNDPTGDPVAQHRGAIEAAAQAGVGRVLYTSHQGASAASPFPAARTHAATEELLAGSGLPWTSLRNGFYAHSLAFLLGPWRQTGRIRIPGDGPVSWTAREDEAEGAAAVLLSAGAYDGPATLTAAAAPTFAQVAEIAGEVAGKPVAVELVDPEQWVAEAVAAGLPEGRARFTLGIFQAAEQGYFAGTDPLLGRLLGREPRSVRDALHAATGS